MLTEAADVNRCEQNVERTLLSAAFDFGFDLYVSGEENQKPNQQQKQRTRVPAPHFELLTFARRTSSPL
jgi:hypothetical protein